MSSRFRSFLIGLISGLTLFITGCDSASQPDPYSVYIDSTVNATVIQRRLKLANRNDSILNALEVARADSLSKTHTAMPPRVPDSVGLKK